MTERTCETCADGECLGGCLLLCHHHKRDVKPDASRRCWRTGTNGGDPEKRCPVRRGHRRLLLDRVLGLQVKCPQCSDTDTENADNGVWMCEFCSRRRPDDVPTRGEFDVEHRRRVELTNKLYDLAVAILVTVDERHGKDRFPLITKTADALRETCRRLSRKDG